MTEVNRYRDGELSSTAMMQQAMEQAHAVDPGAGKKLEWHADHEAMDAARARMHDEPAKVAGALVGKGAKKLVEGQAWKASDPLVKRLMPLVAEGRQKIAEGVRAAALAGGAEIGAAIILGASAVGEAVHAMQQGDELRHKSDIDAMDVAMTNLLDLDPAFKQAEAAKYPGINPQSTMRLFTDSYGKPTEFGRQHIPELQAAADAGARAALDAMRCGGREAYFKMHAGMERRLNDDIAFNKGFENVMFVAAHEGAADKLQNIERALSGRDVRASVGRTVQG
jgi:hypothetical protein